MKTWQGSLGVSAFDGIVSPAYFVAVRLGDVHDRFMHHLLRSQPLIAEYGARSKGIRPAQWDLPWDEFASIKVRLPHAATQRVIADYLDTETGRIDTLITKKRRMIELLEEGYGSRVTREIKSVQVREVQLRRLLTNLVDGPFGSSLTSRHYVDKGARVVRLGNIGIGEFLDEDRAYISTDYFLTLYRHRVQKGDLLIAGLGDARNHVGRACVAPDLGSAIVKADCYCARVNADLASANYLALFLSSPAGMLAVGVAGRGTTRTRINLELAKAIRVPLPTMVDQEGLVENARVARSRLRRLTEGLHSQCRLLEERRRALITAAVTGELAVQIGAG